jgi:uncharacterized protein (TIGR03435 family)
MKNSAELNPLAEHPDVDFSESKMKQMRTTNQTILQTGQRRKWLFPTIVLIVFLGASESRSQAQAKGADPAQGTNSATTKVPSFSVATVKPNIKDDGRWKMAFTQDGYEAFGVTIQKLLQDAYAFYDTDRVIGLPKWAGSEKFDLQAKIDESDEPTFTDLSLAQQRLMLQALLSDRFGLKVHFEAREMPIYALKIANTGLKFKEHVPNHAPDGANPETGGLMTRSRPGQLTEEWVTMPSFATILTYQVNRPVIDATGLTGRYDIQLDWTPEDRTAPSGGDTSMTTPSGPSIFTALKEQLGLWLDPQKGPADVLVIDHVEHPIQN